MVQREMADRMQGDCKVRIMVHFPWQYSICRILIYCLGVIIRSIIGEVD